MESDALALELRKIARLLALQQIAKLSKGEQARTLSAAGFSNREIASLIDTTEGSVRAMLSQSRKRAAAEG
jgi:DNA-directed RNA polymerase specialized sigma24 family protein